MRPRAILAAALMTTACAGPRPCTQTLCPGRSDATFEIRGWSGAVAVSPGVPEPPVPSDSEVTVLAGEAEFRNGTTILRAGAGTSFRYSVSTRAVSIIEVSSGSVSVIVSSSPAATLPPGARYQLPPAR